MKGNEFTMKKIIASFVIIMSLLAFSCIGTAFAANNTNEELIANETKSELVNMKNKEVKSIEDYQKSYGSPTYGLVAYILNKVRIYSIPLTILGVAISAINQYIVGVRHMETYFKGFNTMIAIITCFVICQILPLVFAIIVKGWRG